MKNKVFLFLSYVFFTASLLAQTIHANELKKIYSLNTRSAVASYFTNNGYKLRDAKSLNVDFSTMLFEEWYKGNQRFYMHVQNGKVDGLVWYTDNEQNYLNAYTSILEIQGVSMNVSMNTDRNKTTFLKDEWMFETVKQKKFTEFHVAISKKEGLLDEKNGTKTLYLNKDHVYQKYTLKDGEFHGEYLQYGANGKLEIKANFIDGKKNGKYYTYNENGKVLFDFSLVSDKKDGICKETYYDSLGKISQYVEYNSKDGLLDGYYIKKRYINGKEIVVSNISLSNGLRHGKCAALNSENLFVEGQYVEDLEDGTFFYYKDYEFTSDKIIPRTDVKVLKLYAKQVYENGIIIQRAFYNEDGSER